MITPYLNISGKANEALEFYEGVFKGRDKRIMRYGDAPQNPEFPVGEEQKNLVMYAEMTVCGTKLSFSDTQENVNKDGMVSLAVDFATEDEVRDAYEKLKDGGEVLMELAPQFYSPLFGWVVDKFGISWQIICSKQ